MLWNVPPDVLPGSATAPYVLDRLLNGWILPHLLLVSLLVKRDAGTLASGINRHDGDKFVCS